MSSTKYVECSFLIPLVRDSNLSDGQLHSSDRWDWLINELFVKFSGGTEAPGLYRGFYRDPDSAEQVHDKSRKFIVALPDNEVEVLRKLLSAACLIFQQKCIYLNVAGHVEFITAP